MKKLLFLLAFAIVFMFVACDDDENGTSSQQTTAVQPDSSDGSDNGQPDDGSPITTTLIVGGMTCRSCVNAVNKEVSAIDGVISVTVDLNSGETVVVHEPGVSVDEIKDAIILEAGMEVVG
jgi:copper chaperone CopZ